MRTVETRPRSMAAGGRAVGVAISDCGPLHSTPFRPVLLQIRKRGRLCAIAKLVVSRPLGQWVVAMPYRHRQVVENVSLPPQVLRYVRERGGKQWIVRLDNEGKCLALPLDQVEQVGWLKPSWERPEWFVPLTCFQRIPWQEWDFVEDVVDLTEGNEQSRPLAQQLTLWGVR